MAWRGTEQDPLNGGYHEAPVVPANRSETAALIALLDDDRPSRWLDAQWTPRTVGDNALRALNELWGIDWRWLVSDEPALQSLLPQRADREDEPGPAFGDQWLWSSGIWSDAQRHAIAAALGRWWKAHQGDGGKAPFAWYFRTLPVPEWARTLSVMKRSDLVPDIADRIAERIAAMPPITNEQVYHGTIYEAIAMAGWKFPAHTGITASLTAWAVTPWASNLLSMRSGLAGNEQQLDDWMGKAIATRRRPAARFREDAEASTSPLLNLGLWAYRPTAHRLAALREQLSQDLAFAGTRWLIAHVGDNNYPVLNDVRCRDELKYRDGAKAIPAALAQSGLADTRQLSLDRLIELREWSGGNSVQAPDLSRCIGARVCDWVAAR